MSQPHNSRPVISDRTWQVPTVADPDMEEMRTLSTYIHQKWDELTRTHDGLFLGVLNDDKVPVREGAKPVLYISARENYRLVQRYLEVLRGKMLSKVQKGEVPGKTEKDIPEIDLRVLPPDYTTIPYEEHGLLYLPHPYVVPGGRFNETYGWDSAFIVRGLVRDKKYRLARHVVDNKLYSIRHYGMILNANRSYFLGRSQAPFLTGKVLDIYRHYDRQPEGGADALTWLKSTLEVVVQYYTYWVRPPYLHRKSGLSYYNDMDETPAPEVCYGEPGHYDHARKQLREMHLAREKRMAEEPERPATYQERKDAYYLSLYYLPERPGLTQKERETLPLEEKDAMTGKFYRGDRAMRASGFDPSRRFGFFNVDVIHHLPVCLNSLLYVMESEIAAIYQILAKEEPEGQSEKGVRWTTMIRRWQERAARRKRRINKWLWDDASPDNYIPDASASYADYRDYNFQEALCHEYDIPQHRNYVFATSFYPLWARIATPEQARKVVENVYPKLITPHGLMTSNRETGSQWDAPFAWAPLQVIAVRGLLRYGYKEEALAIANGFLNTVNRGFKVTGKIFEKYDMSGGSHEVSQKIDKGYSTNVEGFGWTNAAVIELLHLLHQTEQDPDTPAAP